MGKKKQFIDKKNSTTYRLVHRSLQDPLAADNDADQQVLVELGGGEPSLEDSRLEEQREHGVFYDDEYNYLQHLKDRSDEGVVWEALEPSKPGKVVLPVSVLPSAREEPVGLLNLAAPHGLDLSLDPDVVAALDDDFDFEDPDNELEDDFIALAEGGALSDCEEGEGEYDSDCDSNDASLADSLDDLYNFDKLSMGSGGGERFTEYSVSSSVLHRGEGLTMLDDKFEQMFKEYDTMGAPEGDLKAVDEEEEREAALILQQLVEDEEEEEDEEAMDKRLTLLQAQRQALVPDTGIRLAEDVAKPKQWDCETILSTYSNIYNHPHQIKLPAKVRVDKKGMAVIDGEDERGDDERGEDEGYEEEDAEEGVTISNLRTKGETKEEKRLRKQAVKENARVRRQVKKATKEIYKDESLKEKKLLIANSNQKNQLKL